MGETSEMKINLNMASEESDPVKSKTVLEHNRENKEYHHEPVQQHHKNKPEEDREFISSLFNHNPEIPRIEQGEFDPTKEEMFSVKTFPSFFKSNLQHMPLSVGVRVNTCEQFMGSPFQMHCLITDFSWSLSEVSLATSKQGFPLYQSNSNMEEKLLMESIEANLS